MYVNDNNHIAAKKILFIGFGQDYGGVEQIAFPICHALVQQNCHLDFLSYYDIPPATAKEIETLNSNWHRVTRYSSNIFKFLRNIFSFYTTHAPYDIVYCNANHASMILYTMPIWFSKKVKLVFHSHVRDGTHKCLHRLCRFLVNRRCNLKIACSRPAADWMYGFNSLAQIVHNGIDAERFKFDINTRNAMRTQYGLQDKLVIGHIGRLTPAKNHLFLLDIFKEILQRNPASVLILIGDGELYSEIKAKIGQLGIDSAVIMFPFQSDIEKFYHMMDIFVLPSIAEGFGLVGIEALASGLPTFYSDTIPNDFSIHDLIHYISLDKSAAAWAEEIVSTDVNNDRNVYFDRVKSSELDQSTMVGKIINLLDAL